MKNSGQLLLKKAKKIIPGGNQLLSKRSELFLPNHWPNYYKKAKGCYVWDLDGKKYTDFAGMGVTSCVLGYSNDQLNFSIKKALDKGLMCTLNSFEEFKERVLTLRTDFDTLLEKYRNNYKKVLLSKDEYLKLFSKKMDVLVNPEKNADEVTFTI